MSGRVASLIMLTVAFCAAEPNERELRIAEAKKRIVYAERNADWVGDLELASIYRTALQWIERLDGEDADWMKKRCVDGYSFGLWRAANISIEDRRYSEAIEFLAEMLRPSIWPESERALQLLNEELEPSIDLNSFQRARLEHVRAVVSMRLDDDAAYLARLHGVSMDAGGGDERFGELIPGDWMNRDVKIHFDETPFNEALADLSEQCGIPIKLLDSSLANQPIYLALSPLRAPDALAELCSSTQTLFTFYDGEIVVDSKVPTGLTFFRLSPLSTQAGFETHPYKRPSYPLARDGDFDRQLRMLREERERLSRQFERKSATWIQDSVLSVEGIRVDPARNIFVAKGPPQTTQNVISGLGYADPNYCYALRDPAEYDLTPDKFGFVAIANPHVRVHCLQKLGPSTNEELEVRMFRIGRFPFTMDWIKSAAYIPKKNGSSNYELNIPAGVEVQKVETLPTAEFRNPRPDALLLNPSYKPDDPLDVLTGCGFEFPEGSGASFFAGYLVVRNTPQELDRIEQFIRDANLYEQYHAPILGTFEMERPPL